MVLALPIALQIIELLVTYGPDAYKALESVIASFRTLVSSDAVTDEQWAALERELDATHAELKAAIAAKLAGG